MTTPRLAVIGGTGFYTFLDDPEHLEVDTPYGRPSAPIAVGTVEGGRRVAFLPRHGLRHEFPAHRVNYRANMWALRSIGVRQVLAPCAVGGLQPERGPGSFVVPDQVFDRTTNRAQTYYDDGAVHVSFADPYCDRLRGALLEGLVDEDPRDGGTLVVIDGPRFSTRAESRWYADQGWSIIGMTGHPEAVLARELALCYATVGLVTDLDAGVDQATAVSHTEVLEVFSLHIDRLRELLRTVSASVADGDDCSCRYALDGLELPLELP
jgi:5'-methylthioadenosine phosphorylase